MSDAAPHDAALALDRRRAPRGEPFAALAALLEATRRRVGVEAVVLGDDDGLVIVASRAARRCDELAAVGARARRVRAGGYGTLQIRVAGEPERAEIAAALVGAGVARLLGRVA